EDLAPVEVEQEQPTDRFGGGGTRRCGSLGYSHVMLPFYQSPRDYLAATSRLGLVTVPLARRPSISCASKPSCLRISSLCSPSSGARLAGTLATSCTWIGLLTVNCRCPPAP